MKKIFAFVLVFAIAIAVMGAGTTVLDLRKTVGATGVLFADTLKGVFVGAINSATSDITVDDITCNTITADTIAGGLVTGDLTIGAGKELYADSAVIDTAVISLGTIATLTGTNGSFSDSCFAETLGVQKGWFAKASFSDSVKANASVGFLGGSVSCYIDSMSYVNGGKDTVWVYVNGVKMIMGVEP